VEFICVIVGFLFIGLNLILIRIGFRYGCLLGLNYNHVISLQVLVVFTVQIVVGLAAVPIRVFNLIVELSLMIVITSSLGLWLLLFMRGVERLLVPKGYSLDLWFLLQRSDMGLLAVNFVIGFGDRRLFFNDLRLLWNMLVWVDRTFLLDFIYRLFPWKAILMNILLTFDFHSGYLIWWFLDWYRIGSLWDWLFRLLSRLWVDPLLWPWFLALCYIL